MPRKPSTPNDQSPSFPYETLEAYLAEVRRLLESRGLRPEWVDELLEGDKNYVGKCFSEKASPLAAAFEIFITEEEANRVPTEEDTRLKIDVSDQARKHLQHLVGLGLWGESVEAVARALIEQSLAAKLETGLLQPSYPIK